MERMRGRTKIWNKPGWKGYEDRPRTFCGKVRRGGIEYTRSI
ncbi:hypothetical protein [Sphingobacterium mizutaii]|nr:hypothetical protein [Sphingobacterium mizutaii]